MTNIIIDISTEGLEPLKHRIIGITTKNHKEEKIFTHREEKTVLQQFWNYIQQNNFQKIIGFNSQYFDIPFLITRSIKYKIQIPNIGNKTQDLRIILSCGNQRQRGKLTDYKKLLDIQFPDYGYGKMHMSLLWENTNLPELKQTLLQDVKITWQLYLHLNEAGIL